MAKNEGATREEIEAAYARGWLHATAFVAEYGDNVDQLLIDIGATTVKQLRRDLEDGDGAFDRLVPRVRALEQKRRGVSSLAMNKGKP